MAQKLNVIGSNEYAHDMPLNAAKMCYFKIRVLALNLSSLEAMNVRQLKHGTVIIFIIFLWCQRGQS